VENLRCDERYSDFRSGWDDVCLTARAAGKRVVVVDVYTSSVEQAEAYNHV
jgi:hypothetical protein